MNTTLQAFSVTSPLFDQPVDLAITRAPSFVKTDLVCDLQNGRKQVADLLTTDQRVQKHLYTELEKILDVRQPKKGNNNQDPLKGKVEEISSQVSKSVDDAITTQLSTHSPEMDHSQFILKVAEIISNVNWMSLVDQYNLKGLDSVFGKPSDQKTSDKIKDELAQAIGGVFASISDSLSKQVRPTGLSAASFGFDQSPITIRRDGADAIISRRKDEYRVNLGNEASDFFSANGKLSQVHTPAQVQELLKELDDVYNDANPSGPLLNIAQSLAASSQKKSKNYEAPTTASGPIRSFSFRLEHGRYIASLELAGAKSSQGKMEFVFKDQATLDPKDIVRVLRELGDMVKPPQGSPPPQGLLKLTPQGLLKELTDRGMVLHKIESTKKVPLLLDDVNLLGLGCAAGTQISNVVFSNSSLDLFGDKLQVTKGRFENCRIIARLRDAEFSTCTFDKASVVAGSITGKVVGTTFAANAFQCDFKEVDFGLEGGKNKAAIKLLKGSVFNQDNLPDDLRRVCKPVSTSRARFELGKVDRVFGEAAILSLIADQPAVRDVLGSYSAIPFFTKLPDVKINPSLLNNPGTPVQWKNIFGEGWISTTDRSVNSTTQNVYFIDLHHPTLKDPTDPILRIFLVDGKALALFGSESDISSDQDNFLQDPTSFQAKNELKPILGNMAVFQSIIDFRRIDENSMKATKMQSSGEVVEVDPDLFD
jgi:hypothetical protein